MSDISVIILFGSKVGKEMMVPPLLPALLPRLSL